jgi:hypothetical protein
MTKTVRPPKTDSGVSRAAQNHIASKFRGPGVHEAAEGQANRTNPHVGKYGLDSRAIFPEEYPK